MAVNIIKTFDAYRGLDVLMTATFNGISFGLLYYSELIFYTVIIVLNAVSLIFLRLMEWRGVLFFCGMYLVGALYNGYSFILSHFLIAEESEQISYATRFVVLLIFVFLNWVYFCKRRPLFTLIERINEAKQQDEIIISNPTPKTTENNDLENSEDVTEIPTPEESEPEVLQSESANTNDSEFVKTHTTEVKRYFIVDTDTGEVVGEKIKKIRRVPLLFFLCSSALCVCLIVLSSALFFSHSHDQSYIESLSNQVEQLSSQVDLLSSQLADGSTEYDALASKYAELKDNYDVALEDLDFYKRDYWDYYFESIFYHNSIGFIVSGSQYYHSYDCEIFKSSDSFWAHNTEYCESIGYAKCPLCWH